MATRYLGPTVDIHGGGADLIFPHHECEIAQTEPITGQKPYVRYWMHTAMVEYQGEKMSKSLGNLVKVSDVLETYNPDALRLYLLSHHYRTPWEYQDEGVDEYARLADDIREAVNFPAYGIEQIVDVIPFREQFFNAIEDDFNVPVAIEAVSEIVSAILEAPEDDDVRDAQEILQTLSDVLGLALIEQ